jgi:hypothetical protein
MKCLTGRAELSPLDKQKPPGFSPPAVLSN